VHLRDPRAIPDSVAAGRAGLFALFRGHFIVSNPAGSSASHLRAVKAVQKGGFQIDRLRRHNFLSKGPVGGRRFLSRKSRGARADGAGLASLHVWMRGERRTAATKANGRWPTEDGKGRREVRKMESKRFL
jgi:hypothetical protein